MNPAYMLGAILFLSALPAVSSALEPPAPEPCSSASCHAETRSSAVLHDPAGEGRCTVCHVPAGDFLSSDHSASSFLAGNTASPPCLSCHPGTARSLSGPFVHPPAEEDGCTVCHNPHGSAHPYLLVAPYPKETYTLYGAGKYTLCWNCHEESLAADKFTESSTAFRMGKRNFHYSHLHKRRGITCKACHDPHGTAQERLVRQDGPSGEEGWNSRMTFLTDSSGGRCIGGCHKDISYRR